MENPYLDQPAPTQSPVNPYLADMQPAPPRGIAETLALSGMRGVRDVLDSSAQFAARGAESAANWLAPRSSFAASLRGMREDTEKTIREAEADYKANWQPGMSPTAETIGRIGGQIVGTLPIGIAGRGVLSGAATGAAAGAVAEPVLEPGDNYYGQVGTKALVGAGAGAAGGLVGRALARPAPGVRDLIDAGVTPTPGQIAGGAVNRAEEALGSIPVVGDVIKSARNRAIEEFNTATINKALAPIGVKLPKGSLGHEAIAAGQKAISDAYDNVVPRMGLSGLDARFATDVNASFGKALYPQAKQRAGQIVADEFNSLMQVQGRSGEAVDAFIKRMGTISRDLRGGDEIARDTARVLSDVQEAFLDLLGRQNPAARADLDKARKAAAMFMRVENAAGRSTTANAPGVFTPQQLTSAARNMDTSARNRVSARGDALMQDWAERSRYILTDKLPDSGTARRMWTGLGGLAAGGYGAGTTMGLPALAAAPLAMLPYVPGGRQLAAGLMTYGRSPTTEALGRAVTASSAPLGVSLFGPPR